MMKLFLLEILTSPLRIVTVMTQMHGLGKTLCHLAKGEPLKIFLKLVFMIPIEKLIQILRSIPGGIIEWLVLEEI